MKPPIFVIGNPRSGTTILRLMLTCHQNIVIPPECGFAVWLFSRYKDWIYQHKYVQLSRLVDDVMSCRKIETWGIDRGELLDYLKQKSPSDWPQAVSFIYEYYGILQGSDFTRWGDKNNFYLNHIHVIKEMFPDAFFIHIVRDGRDVACSYKRLNRLALNSKYSPRFPKSIEEIADSWRQNIMTILTAFEVFDFEDVVEVRLEDLTQRPKEELARVCECLGEEFDPQMLEYNRITRERNLEPQEFLKWKDKIHLPLTSEGKYEYKRTLSTVEIDIFEKIAGEVLQRYNYLNSA